MCTNLLNQLWNDDHGAILSAEAILILTILVITCVVGLAQVTGSLSYGIHLMYASFEASNHPSHDRFDDSNPSETRHIDYGH
ncbi:hypothetical protein [Calycomorphotria hydatis]|uniref:Uncharacterized protein n=1 Tax=Calycomorphotria hydatis TaxID=2528027 RepID=A0A517TC47_9PLAN|nr:hypothetical protein [Calycomorphotria hydatis]QDT65944.1 hypothetical protein V22_32080 [Calycomorphotria hydatis]